MNIDYKNPDYTAILKKRAVLLRKLRAPGGFGMVPSLKAYYRDNPIDFIRDWGVTSDPRNIERGLPVVIPFVPFGRQVEWLEWMLECWKNSTGGLTEKSRDMGCSVAAMALFATLALFHRDFVGGVGSRKEDLIDSVGNPSTLFYKVRMFLQHVPYEFRAGWQIRDKVNNSHMKISLPETGSVIVGEAGANIGRGGRSTMYLKDESAFLQNAFAIEASLSQNTRCVFDLSSVNGTDNPFAEKRFSGRVPVFTFNWRDDPRKDQEWYDREVARLPEVIVAQEIDLDYGASKEGILIPSAWVQAAVDAHLILGVTEDAKRKAGLDVADTGTDKNAFAARHGVILDALHEWSGTGSDIFATTEKTFKLCDELGLTEFDYDADGLGVGVRGDARVINGRDNRQTAQVLAVEYRGSGSVVNPDDYVIAPDHKRGHTGRTNGDFFENRKAQSWWALRVRFERTYQKIVQKRDDINAADCIAIPSRLENRVKLVMELSQPTYSINTKGKIIVDKSPEGSKSPNLADSVVIAYAPSLRKKRIVGVF